MERKRKGKPEFQLKIARERIGMLFEESDKIVKEDRKLAKRYIELARRIGMRYNIRMPAGLKRKYCRHCRSHLYGSQHRLRRGMVTIKCVSCGRTIRYPYRKKSIK